VVYIQGNGTLNSAAMRPFGLCHLCDQVCSDNCGEIIISWKICFEVTPTYCSWHITQVAT